MEQQVILGLLFLVAATTSHALTHGVTELPQGGDDLQMDVALPGATCPFPYTLIGKRCLFFGVLYKSNHHQAFSTCQSMVGNLITIDDATDLQNIISTIRARGMQESDFWIDGSSEAEAGNWTTSDGTSLVMGTPFWAAGEDFSKPGINSTACAALTSAYGHMMSDEVCTKQYAPICEMPPPSTEAAFWTDEEDNISCPQFYVPVGGFCLGFLTWAEEPWVEAKLTCESLQGTLLALSKIELLRMIYEYLHEKEIASHSFWIGGSDRENEGSWVWSDGLPIAQGTPFWGIRNESAPEMLYASGDDVTEPDGEDDENCLALTAAGMHYFRDKDCSIKMNPLCVTLPTA